ncbi:capsid cement protein [Xylophilus ampelinus]|uniref:Uncharacterized protein n=1 Tax=Xylophilus ampelinus TaxID=54067 RepID=A0A318T2J4_9BURK|nr:capsid cement protein [Xylophilus ampelinus]MCS4509141.1 DUF2190 family protein [Xylophilus ampelinus]PYE79831.1 hypothetical protein DFQ15_101151 [Xylophilus ampelinus]
MASGNISILTLSIKAAGALSANRLVTQAGAYPAAGAAAFGVTRTSAEFAGDLVPVDVMGTAIAEAGAAIPADTPLQVDATGRVVALTVGGKAPVGRSMDAAAGAGDLIEILLVPNTGAVSAAS